MQSLVDELGGYCLVPLDAEGLRLSGLGILFLSRNRGFGRTLSHMSARERTVPNRLMVLNNLIG